MMDDGKVTGTVFRDLTMMLNLEVRHSLIYFGFLTSKLFKSCLNNRTQQVSYGHFLSNKQRLKSGAPRGSLLQPLLSLIYVNNLAYCNEKLIYDFRFICTYVYGPTLYKSAHYLSDIQNTLLQQLTLVDKCCSDNNMVLNPHKTKCMVIGLKNK